MDAGFAKSAARAKAASSDEVKKLAPHTTGKRLPWLAGKGSRAVPVTPTKRLESDTETLSPSTRPSSRKASTAVAPKAANTSIPAARRRSLAVPTERRVLPVASSSPSPVTRHRLSQARRASVVHKGPSPLRAADSHRPSVSHEPQKRLSVVQHHDEELEEDNLCYVRPRADSLAPVPDHLERSDTPDSFQMPTRRDVVSSASPATVSRVQMSPSQPAPGRSTFERVGDRRISNAIEGLEDMVQEAVEIADETADQRQVEVIYEIIEDARTAIQDASEDPTRHLMATTSPLAASESSGDPIDVSEFSSQFSLGRYPDRRTRPMPGRAPPPPTILIQSNIVDESTRLVDLEAHASLQSDPASFDWAYSRQGKRPHSRSSSPSTSDNSERGRSRFSTQSDLLLPPQPIQVAPRNHVDFVLRPITRDQSRGRSRRRPADESAVRIRRHRHQHRRSSGQDSRSRSGRRQYKYSEFGQIDTSFDEENIPAKMYGNALSVREEAHHHTFSLRRHYRRQPIARNWSTGKKRLTATIACINTALLGIVVGIYVSNSF